MMPQFSGYPSPSTILPLKADLQRMPGVKLRFRQRKCKNGTFLKQSDLQAMNYLDWRQFSACGAFRHSLGQNYAQVTGLEHSGLLISSSRRMGF
jgi:hypothetical protein